MSVVQCSWSDVAGGWDHWRSEIEEGDGRISDVLLAGLGDLPGSDVLELAAGNGELAARLADMVGPEGTVLATDEAEGMVALLSTRLGPLTNVAVAQADACATGLTEATYDAVVCRFGLMLVPDPAAALAEVRRVLRPGGRVAAAVWGDASGNPWLASVGMAAAMQGLVGGGPPSGPGSPFSLGDTEHLRGMFEQVGFAEARVDPVNGVRHYDSVDDLVAMGTSLAPPLHRAMPAATPEQVDALHETVRQLTAPFATPDGALDIPMRALVATASSP
jgi:SAM-dependent methyltransferase